MHRRWIRLVGSALLLGSTACAVDASESARTDDEDEAAITSASAASPPALSGAGAQARRHRRACEATSPRQTPVAVHVFPDEGEAPYVDLLASATQSVRVFGYLMGTGGVLDTLRAKAKAGVDVRVILDGQTERHVNDRYRVLLEGDGAHVVWSDAAFSYMHAKSIVVDDARALVSTGNYSRSFMLKERNFAATLTEPQDVADLAALFDADWTQASPDLQCTRLVVSPVNSRPRIEALIASAKREILVESMQLADPKMRDALVERAAAGVSIRVILAAPSWVGANQRAGQFLAAHAIGARSLVSPAIHVKAVVVDGERAYLGSENLSGTSLDHNREIGLIVSDAAGVQRMMDTFERDYAGATAF